MPTLETIGHAKERTMQLKALCDINYAVLDGPETVGWITKSLLAMNGRWTFTASKAGLANGLHDTAPDYLTPEAALAGAINLSDFINAWHHIKRQAAA